MGKSFSDYMDLHMEKTIKLNERIGELNDTNSTVNEVFNMLVCEDTRRSLLERFKQLA